MLTKHHYNDIADGWDTDTILDCCKMQDSGDPACVDCCYDSWQDELKTVTQKYNSVVEQATQLKNKLTFITDRKNKYKTWLDELNNAQDLALAICNQLELIAMQSDKIWYNSCKAVDAVETLFCMIRDFFMQLDLIKTQYDDVQNCITNNTDTSLVKGQGILKALDDYKAKLDILIKLKDDIIKNMVAAVKIANLIRNNISTKDCNYEGFVPCPPNPKPCAGDDIFYGFKTIICEWYKAFACDVPCVDNGTGNTDTNPQATTQTNMSTTLDDCGDENCELLPTFDFPICNNSYKACVQKWFAADETEYTELTARLQEANKQKEALAACKNSLVKAIKAVDPKTRCN
ncbi:MAG: hypothetical protein ABI237_14980 [Ginsengibacter sp.]